MKEIYNPKNLSIVDISDFMLFSGTIYWWTYVPVIGIYIICIHLIVLQ